jgi:hypothetical protein
MPNPSKEFESCLQQPGRSSNRKSEQLSARDWQGVAKGVSECCLIWRGDLLRRERDTACAK